LVEPYKLSRLYLYHFDFYRITDPSELEDVGFREYFNPDTVCLVEWPERAEGMLPPPDLRIDLEVTGSGRQARIEAGTEAGRLCLKRMETR
jgi:tRNA threonylcarbamoyladenosine biosynthesis protein TsaE